MADRVDTEARSRMMSAVRSKDTAPELALRRALWSAGIRGYRKHRKDLAGSPDLAWIGRNVAVFVDGAFWHGHESAFKRGQSGVFWDEKIARNRERDRAVDLVLRESGWTVLRFWDFEIDRDVERCVGTITEALK